MRKLNLIGSLLITCSNETLFAGDSLAVTYIANCNFLIEDAYTSQELHVGNMEVIVCRLAHPGETYWDTQNNAYLVSKNGKSVFHSADIDPMQIDKYTGMKPNQMHIDLGMINEDFASIENAGLTASFINARINLSMHLPDYVDNDWLDSFKEEPGLLYKKRGKVNKR